MFFFYHDAAGEMMLIFFYKVIKSGSYNSAVGSIGVFESKILKREGKIPLFSGMGIKELCDFY